MKRVASCIVLATVVTAAQVSWAQRPNSCDNPHGDSTYYCLGAVRAKAVLLEDLREGRSQRDVADLVALLNHREALPLLREMLNRQDQGGQGLWAKGYAARALGMLGDKGATVQIQGLARSSEGTNATLWDSAFESLVELGNEEALTYARDLAKRTKKIKSTGDRNRVSDILPVIVEGKATDLLPILVQWAGQTEEYELHHTLHAKLNGARLRLGDRRLLEKMRKILAQRNGVVPTWPSHYIGGLGDHPDDVPALVRFSGSTSPESREAYNAIDRLVIKLGTKGGDEGWQKARKNLIEGLRHLTKHREDRSHIQFEARQLARHHLSLARLGDSDSRRRLLELTSEDPETVIPWIAARGALELGLPGAPNRAAEVMLKAAHSSTRFHEVRRELLDQAALTMGESDPRWVVMALDSNSIVTDRALYHMARQRPAKACSIMISAAQKASQKRSAHNGVARGMVTLTVLGDSCRPELEKVLPRSDVHPHLWGISMELLAMMKSPVATEWATKVRFRRHLTPYAERALTISKLP